MAKVFMMAQTAKLDDNNINVIKWLVSCYGYQFSLIYGSFQQLPSANMLYTLYFILCCAIFAGTPIENKMNSGLFVVSL